jgi:hypothetical protein
VPVIGLTAVLAAQTDALRLNWKQGETLRYRQIIESTVVMSGLPGGDMTVTNSVAQVQPMTVEKVDADGTATIRTTTESIKMDIATPMGTMTYDSTSKTPPSDPMMATMANVMGGTLGQPLTIVITADGRVKSVTGGSAMLEKIKAKAAGMDLSAMGDLEKQFSDEAMRAAFDQGFGSLPGRPIKTGETWTDTVKLPNPMGDMTITATYTMQGIETVNGRPLTKITHTSKIVGGGGEMGPMSTQLGSGTGSGEMLFDHRLGRVQRAVYLVSMPMTLSMPGPDGTPMTMGGQVNTTTTMELIEK